MTKSRSSSLRKKTERKPADLHLVSWSALTEYLDVAPHLILVLRCLDKDRQRLTTLLDERSLKIPIQMSSEGLQVVIKVPLLSDLDLETVASDAAAPPRMLMIDHISDTRNLGAIIRSAAYFGVFHIILARDRQASITQGTVDTCQGGLAYCKLYSVTNLSRAVKLLKAADYWIIGADLGGRPLAELTSFPRSCLVVGAEDKGISPNILKNLDVAVKIEAASALDSLNVSVATGILLHHIALS